MNVFLQKTSSELSIHPYFVTRSRSPFSLEYEKHPTLLGFSLWENCFTETIEPFGLCTVASKIRWSAVLPRPWISKFSNLVFCSTKDHWQYLLDLFSWQSRNNRPCYPQIGKYLRNLDFGIFRAINITRHNLWQGAGNSKQSLFAVRSVRKTRNSLVNLDLWFTGIRPLRSWEKVTGVFDLLYSYDRLTSMFYALKESI